MIAWAGAERFRSRLTDHWILSFARAALAAGILLRLKKARGGGGESMTRRLPNWRDRVAGGPVARPGAGSVRGQE